MAKLSARGRKELVRFTKTYLRSTGSTAKYEDAYMSDGKVLTKCKITAPDAFVTNIGWHEVRTKAGRFDPQNFQEQIDKRLEQGWVVV